MRTTYTEFGKLKEIIVGVELDLPKRVADFTFKHFYSTNLKYNFSHFEDYRISSEYVAERNEDLDNLATILSNMGIIVRRPDKLHKMINIKTPEFESLVASPSNVRDTTLIYGNNILETPPLLRCKIFEHFFLHDTGSNETL